MSKKTDKAAAQKARKAAYDKQTATSVVTKVTTAIIPLLGVNPDNTVNEAVANEIPTPQNAAIIGKGLTILTVLVKGNKLTLDELLTIVDSVQPGCKMFIAPLVCKGLGVELRFTGVMADELNEAIR